MVVLIHGTECKSLPQPASGYADHSSIYLPFNVLHRKKENRFFGRFNAGVKESTATLQASASPSALMMSSVMGPGGIEDFQICPTEKAIRDAKTDA